MNKQVLNCLLQSALVLCFSASAVIAASPNSAKKDGKERAMKIEKTPFGKMPDGTPVDLYTLRNKQDMAVKITPYGAIITEINVTQGVKVHRSAIGHFSKGRL